MRLGAVRALTPALARERSRMGALRGLGCCCDSGAPRTLGALGQVGINVSTGAQMVANAQAAPGVPASVKGQLLTAAAPEQVAATEGSALAGIQAVANGGKPSNEQIQSGFALASAGAMAVASGVSISAAMPVMLPIAVVVFGAGAAGAALITSALGMHGGTTQSYACTAGDTSVRGASPADPNWSHASKPSLYDGFNGTDRAGIARPWSPATSGKFETWARPILQLAEDMLGNCLALPGRKVVSQDTVNKARDAGSVSAWGQEEDANTALWELGLVMAWNNANSGAPMRTLTMTTPPAGYAHGQVALDPVQAMLWRFRRTLKDYEAQYKSGAPISIQVADPAPKRQIAFHLPPPPPRHVALRLGPAPALRASAPGSAPLGTGAKVAAAAGAASAGVLLWWLGSHRWRWVTPRWAAKLVR